MGSRSIASEDRYEQVMELAKRRGFFWPSYEIYGGVAGFYDLGPLGARLKDKIIALWRHYFIRSHSHIVVEIETPVIAPARVFEASGHLEHFTDPIVECLSCQRKFRADHLIEERLDIKAEGLSLEEMTQIIHEHDIRCPVCGGPLDEVRSFNLLFKTTIGPYSENVGYLRPETAQGMFVAFKRVHEVTRQRLPLGIAQIGRVARNEISPRQGMIRLREFTIAEIEFFFDPEDPWHGGILEELLDRVSHRKLRVLRADAKAKGIDKPEEYGVREAI
ncbi:MAG TPA: glycine--tRNA ligase, partial [Pyrodictium sp.]|nr:glycine--tRNA ligase [Pyrodictium sp.]